MRTFLIHRRGVDRVMRTYGIASNGESVIPGCGLKEEIPAPHARDEVKRWSPQDQADVTNIREVNEEDLPR